MVYSGNVAGDAGSRLVRVTKILGLVTAVLLRKQERRERCCGLRQLGRRLQGENGTVKASKPIAMVLHN